MQRMRGEHADLEREEKVLLGRLERLQRQVEGGAPATLEEVTLRANLSNVYQFQGKMDLAVEQGTTAIDAYMALPESERERDPKLLATLQGSIGLLHRRAGRFEESLAMFEKALASARSAGDEEGAATMLASLGLVHRKLKHDDDAVAAYGRAIEAREGLLRGNIDPARQHLELGSLHSNLGNVHVDFKRYDRALVEHERALKIHEGLASGGSDESRASVANSLNTIGIINIEAGRHEKAIPYLERAMRIYKQLDKAARASCEPDIAMLHNNLGHALVKLGKEEGAEKEFLAGYKAYKRLVREEPHVHAPFLKVAVMNLQLFYNKSGQQAKALQVWSDCLQFLQQVSGIDDEMVRETSETVAELAGGAGLPVAAAKQKPMRRGPKTGRNDPCPCGSGQKYKKCCLPKELTTGEAGE